MSTSSGKNLLTITVELPGNARQEAFFVQQGVSIGRNQDETICLDDPAVDRVHSKVRRQPDGTMVLECVGLQAVITLPDGHTTHSLALEPGLAFQIGPATLRCQSANTRGTVDTPANLWARRCPKCHADLCGDAKDLRRCPACSTKIQYLQTNLGFEGWLPRQVGPYAIRAFCARGGMGVVLRGLHEKKDFLAAVKLIDGDDGTAAQKRFDEEVRLLQAVVHPHLVRLQDHGSDAKLRWLAMDWVQGQSLAQLLESRVETSQLLPVQTVAALLRQVVAGLSHLHSNSIMHRDLKPANILIGKDELVKVADFGLAKSPGGAIGATTRTGTVAGTLAYLAPEVTYGRPATVESDVFSLGVVWYEMLTGHRPSRPYRPVTVERADVPAKWAEMIARCLADAPAARPSCREIASVMETPSKRQTVPQPPANPPRAAASTRTRFGLAPFSWLSSVRDRLRFFNGTLARLPRRIRYASIGLALTVLLLAIILVWRWPSALDAEYREYQKALTTGRGSVVFLKDAAPQRYTTWLARADSGDSTAQLFIGRCYQEGIVVKEDQATAIAWLQKSAAQGNDFAMHTIGLAYKTGKGVVANHDEAMRWYTRAAESGNCMSMAALGDMNNSGSSNDLGLKLKWYRKSADAGNSFAMRKLGDFYRYGIGVEKDAAESDRWYDRAAKAGDFFMAGKLFGNRLAPHFTAYLAIDASTSTRSSSLLALRALQKEYQRLDLAEVSTVFSESDLSNATTRLQEVDIKDPLRVFYDELVQQYIAVFSTASKSQRVEHLLDFSAATGPLVSRWFADQRYEDVTSFWERAYKDISFSSISTDGDCNQLVTQLSCAITSLLKNGQRKEAATLLADSLKVCDTILQERPWDWYVKEAYRGLCFQTADTLVELGEAGDTQPLLRRAWGVIYKQYGKDSLLDRYPILPLKGKVPQDVSDVDREFFERFVPGADIKKSGMKRFTIKCDFAGTQSPFYVYVLAGPRGYAELQDQFRWLKEIRGGEVPAKARDSFLRLNKIAVENHVDFMELCVYALGDKKEEGKESEEKKK